MKYDPDTDVGESNSTAAPYAAWPLPNEKTFPFHKFTEKINSSKNFVPFSAICSGIVF